MMYKLGSIDFFPRSCSLLYIGTDFFSFSAGWSTERFWTEVKLTDADQNEDVDDWALGTAASRIFRNSYFSASSGMRPSPHMI